MRTPGAEKPPLLLRPAGRLAVNRTSIMRAYIDGKHIEQERLDADRVVLKLRNKKIPDHMIAVLRSLAWAKPRLIERIANYGLIYLSAFSPGWFGNYFQTSLD